MAEDEKMNEWMSLVDENMKSAQDKISELEKKVDALEKIYDQNVDRILYISDVKKEISELRDDLKHLKGLLDRSIKGDDKD